MSLPADFALGQSELTSDLVVYYCETEAQSLCFIEHVRVSARCRSRPAAPMPPWSATPLSSLTADNEGGNH